VTPTGAINPAVIMKATFKAATPTKIRPTVHNKTHKKLAVRLSVLRHDLSEMLHGTR
jgi:hypothetical protein